MTVAARAGCRAATPCRLLAGVLSVAEELQERRVELGGLLDLRNVPALFKDEQLGVGNLPLESFAHRNGREQVFAAPEDERLVLEGREPAVEHVFSVHDRIDEALAGVAVARRYSPREHEIDSRVAGESLVVKDHGKDLANVLARRRVQGVERARVDALIGLEPGGVDEDQAVYLFRVREGECGGGPPAERVAHERGSLDLQLLVEAREKIDERAHAIVHQGLVGLSEPYLVRHYHPVLPGKRADGRSPVRRVASEPVQQYDHGAAPGFDVVNLRAVDGREPVGHGGRLPGLHLGGSPRVKECPERLQFLRRGRYGERHEKKRGEGGRAGAVEQALTGRSIHFSFSRRKILRAGLFYTQTFSRGSPALHSGHSSGV